jgi:hypothetical protein
VGKEDEANLGEDINLNAGMDHKEAARYEATSKVAVCLGCHTAGAGDGSDQLVRGEGTSRTPYVRSKRPDQRRIINGT